MTRYLIEHQNSGSEETEVIQAGNDENELWFTLMAFLLNNAIEEKSRLIGIYADGQLMEQKQLDDLLHDVAMFCSIKVLSTSTGLSLRETIQRFKIGKEILPLLPSD